MTYITQSKTLKQVQRGDETSEEGLTRYKNTHGYSLSPNGILLEEDRGVRNLSLLISESVAEKGKGRWWTMLRHRETTLTLEKQNKTQHGITFWPAEWKPYNPGDGDKVNIIVQILAPDDDEAVHFWVILCQIKGFNKWQKISV